MGLTRVKSNNVSFTTLDVSNNLTVDGNLTVKGTTVTVDTATAQTVDLGDGDKICLLYTSDAADE